MTRWWSITRGLGGDYRNCRKGRRLSEIVGLKFLVMKVKLLKRLRREVADTVSLRKEFGEWRLYTKGGAYTSFVFVDDARRAITELWHIRAEGYLRSKGRACGASSYIW